MILSVGWTNSMIINILLVLVIWSDAGFALPTQNAPLIVNGTDANPGEFPYYVYISITFPDDRLTYACGASLIGPDRVLTAAHCLMNNRSLLARSLRVYPNFDSKLPNILGNESYRGYPIVHQRYNAISFLNDIGVIKLEEAIPLSKGMKTVCLPERSYPVGTVVTIAGFGNDSTPTIPEYLQKYETPITSRTNSGGQHIITTFTKNQSACGGDSGGPVVVKAESLKGKCRDVLLGAVSFGDENCRAEGHHTNVYHYLDWIREHM